MMEAVSTMSKSGRARVFPCTRSNMDEKPIGYADSARHAARMINKHLEGRDGDDYGLDENDVVFVPELGAYFIAE